MNANRILIFGSGALLGALALAALLVTQASQLMVRETISPLDHQATVTSIVETAGERGWKVPKVHDLRKTMRKFGNEVRPATVIELCQPGHAARLLAHSETRLVTSFMPCRVAIYERDGGEVVVSRMNAGLMSYLFPGEIGHVMGEATAETEAILSRVTL